MSVLRPERLAFACLLGLAAAVPLLPLDVDWLPTGKHVLFLGLSTLGCLLLVADALTGRPAPALGTPTDVALGAFLLAVVPSALVATNPGMARYGAGLFVAMAFTFVLAVRTLTTPARVGALLLVVLGAGVVIAAHGLVGYAGFVEAGARETARSRYLSTRFFAHSYLAMQYLVMVLSGGLVYLFEKRLGGRARWLVPPLLVIAAFWLVVGSRGAYLAVIVALLAYVLVRVRASGGRARGLVVRAAVAAIVLGAGLLVAAQLGWLGQALRYATDRVLLLFDPAASDFNYSRLLIWRDALLMTSDHLLFGVGIGNFDTVLPGYHVSPRPVPHAHNQYLHVFAELGLVGLVTFLFVLGHAGLAIGRGARALGDDARRAPLLFAAIAALAAEGVYFLFETPLVWPEAGSLIMVLVAVVTRAGCRDRDARVPAPRALGGLLLVLALVGWIAPSWIRYGRATRLTGEHLEALERVEQAVVARDRDAARAHAETALARLRAAIAAFPWRADLAGLEGALLFELAALQPTRAGKLAWLEQARDAYRRADALQPGSFKYLNPLGKIEMRLGAYDDAVTTLRRAAWSHQRVGAVETYASLGRALKNAGRHEEAWIIFSDLVERYAYHQDQPEILLDGAEILLELERRFDVARAMLRWYREETTGEEPDPQVEAFIDDLLAEMEAIILRDASQASAAEEQRRRQRDLERLHSDARTQARGGEERDAGGEGPQGPPASEAADGAASEADG